MKPLLKVKNEITRLENQQAQIAERLDSLYKQRTQLENTEMIQAIRDAEFDAADVVAVIQAIKKGGGNLTELLALATNHPNTTEENTHESME